MKKTNWYNKYSKPAIHLAIVALALSASLQGCGKSEPEAAPPGSVVAPIGPGIPGVPGVPGVPGANCISVDQPLSFTAQGIYTDSIAVRFGPAYGTGTVFMTVGQTMGTYVGRGVDGMIYLSFSSPNTPGFTGGYNNSCYQYGYYNPATCSPSYPNTTVGSGVASGTLILSTMTRQDIKYRMGPSSCVNALSANLSYSSGSSFGLPPFVHGDLVLQVSGEGGTSVPYTINVTYP